MLAKLTITVLDDDAVDSHGGSLPRRIDVQYNPAELTLQKGAQIAEQNIPGLDSPLLQFVRGQTEKLTLELTVDAETAPAGAAPVRDRVELLYRLVKIQSKTHAVPRVRVTWGELAFVGVAESVQRKLTLFDRDGTLKRAVVSITFREYRTLEEQLEELNLQSADHTRVTVVRRGDRLDTIAYREYRDAGWWPELAAVNRIENPGRLLPGTVLSLPTLNELRAERSGV